MGTSYSVKLKQWSMQFAVALSLSAASPSFACDPRESDFMAFFDRFSNDTHFQARRLSETIRFGRYRGKEGKERMTWRDLPPERIREVYGTSIVPNVEQRKAAYLLKLGREHTHQRTVSVVKDESDSYVVTLYFTNRGGCWTLYGIKDTSNLTWNE